MRYAGFAIAVAVALMTTAGARAQAPTEEPKEDRQEPKEPPAQSAQAAPPDAEEADEADEAEVEAEGADEEPDPGTEGQAGQAAQRPETEPDLLEEATEPSEEDGEADTAQMLTESRTADIAEEDGDIIPLDVSLHGFYRARWNWMQNVPRPDPDGAGPIIPGTNDLSFGYHRLRLSPTVTYGPKKDAPIAALKIQADALDNVVFGDNAGLQGVPLFAETPSLTNIDGFDLKDSINLTRAWLEFMVPVGQIRVGRMPSHWAEGLLAHGGEGLAEWGDFLDQTTFDRILFATRPLTIFNALTKGDSRPTPLIFAFAYDRLVEQPQIGGDIQVNATTTRFEERSTFPFQWVGDKSDQVNEVVFALAWDDQDWGRLETDHLTAGAYFVYRWQNSLGSKAFISDFMWDVQYGLGGRLPSFFAQGEFLNIQAKGDEPIAGLLTSASIFGVIGRAGINEPGKYKAFLEAGFDSGDDEMLNPELKVRPFHENVKVGLLLYQVALPAVTNRALGPVGANALGANGSVWNSKYFWPQARYTLIPGIELHGGFLIAWAHKKDAALGLFDQADDSCGFSNECFLGWEADLALRVRWGDNDLLWWDLESAIMQPGSAISRQDGAPNGLSSDLGDLLWTIQTRVAMQF
ncbi:MAG: hypothetical protein ACOC97_02885 [Myxococcota bacterium]